MTIIFLNGNNGNVLMVYADDEEAQYQERGGTGLGFMTFVNPRPPLVQHHGQAFHIQQRLQLPNMLQWLYLLYQCLLGANQCGDQFYCRECINSYSIQ